MILWYFLIGFFTEIVAAIPPGAANFVVIKERIQQEKNSLHKLIWGAGLGELFIAGFALQYAMGLARFFKQNQWFQISISLIVLSLGIWILLKPKNNREIKTKKETSIKVPKTVKGFLLAVLNPPVLVYWVLVFSALSMYAKKMIANTPWETLTLFLFGIFLGKISVLYGYSYWGKRLSNSSNASTLITRTLGITLVIVGFFQSFRIFIQ